MRKRIWWLLYIRDRQCAVALGLPTRIRDEDCDLEMLESSDFEDENVSPYPKFLGTQKREHVLYCIHMAKLAIYCQSSLLLHILAILIVDSGKNCSTRVCSRQPPSD